ncbi:hypothetical protein RIF29_31687 [Crotalaria pallida]|uniref:Transmembrane protein n=1 Tax=Crotalaria pallida TaxID=3830 RepID=A0AAN9HXR1_CROPI
MDDHHNKDAPHHLYAFPLFAFLGEWFTLFVTFFIALFFFPLTPSFTLHSTSASVLNVTGDNHFTTNLGIGILADDSNSLGSSIIYDSLHVSIFQGHENLSTFSLPSGSNSLHQQEQEPTKNAIETKYHNVTVKVDEWSNDNGDAVQVHGTSSSSCGLVYLDLWFSANARYVQPMLSAIKDKVQGHCGQVKLELCSSTTGTVFNSFLSSCDVYSDVINKFRLVLFMFLILLLVTAVALPFLLDQFFCSSKF